jgi:hypothetical protein
MAIDLSIGQSKKQSHKRGHTDESLEGDFGGIKNASLCA